MKTINLKEIEKAAGGEGAPIFVDPRNNVCPVHGNHHQFVATGESRPTDAWFYNTEERYLCACGYAYWEAGVFSIRTYEKNKGASGGW